MNNAYDPVLTPNCEYLHPVLSVSDLPASIAFYTQRLGFRVGFTAGDPIRIAGVGLGFGSIHLRQGTPSPTSAGVYLVVDDVDGLYEQQRSNGVSIASAPARKPWGLREYEVRDPDGYTLTFGQHVPATEPRIEVQRIEVTARVEARLAALLDDLARHKNMSLGELLEETVLHTFEPVQGGGVTSPHDTGTRRHIERLKVTHGIDYDAHDAYRFVDKP